MRNAESPVDLGELIRQAYDNAGEIVEYMSEHEAPGKKTDKTEALAAALDDAIASYYAAAAEELDDGGHYRRGEMLGGAAMDDADAAVLAAAARLYVAADLSVWWRADKDLDEQFWSWCER